MKIRILVCDNEPEFARQFAERLQQLTPKEISAEISCAVSAEQLPDEALQKFDLCFLDIDLGKSSGIDLARRMRRLHSDAVIIFVTNYIEYSPEGYEVDAFRYLLKAQTEALLPKYYADARALLQKRENRFVFSKNGEPFSVPVCRIAYFESSNRIILIHLQGGTKTETFYGTMEELEQQMADSGFLRIHQSYLVNPDYIEKLGYETAQLKDQSGLPVSRKRYPSVRIQYQNWKMYRQAGV